MIDQILQNKIIMSAVIGTIICQTWKVLHNLFWEKRLDGKLFFATGGMPSSHSTFVAALATAIGYTEGWLSPIFLLSLGFAMVTIRDAFGVRHTVDDLIKTVNDIIHKKKFKMVMIKKIAGHTPIQVMIGTLLGIGVAVGVYFLW